MTSGSTPDGGGLRGPLLRMAQFFFGPSLGRVNSAKDVYTVARQIRDAGIQVRRSEERLLTQVLWCVLQIQHDREETDQHQALLTLADLVLAVIEDDDFFIPEGVSAGGREEIELLALEVQTQAFQLDMSLGATIGLYDLQFGAAADLQGAWGRVPRPLRSPELQAVFQRLANHLTQGEELLTGQADPAKQARHRDRLAQAYERTGFLLARLLAKTPAADHPVLRENVIKRELKRIEVDALGIERIGAEEQARETRRLLQWTEQDLGVELNDANKAALAAQLQAVAREKVAGAEEDDDDWLSGMD